MVEAGVGLRRQTEGGVMRSAVIIGCGFAVWGLCLAVAHFTAGLNARSATVATMCFIGLWFVAAAINLWMGVMRAGYSFAEELPIFLLIFAMPAAVAAFVQWKCWGLITK
jgi:hypothetical protein